MPPQNKKERQIITAPYDTRINATEFLVNRHLDLDVTESVSIQGKPSLNPVL